MNDLSVIEQQNERAKTQALINKLKVNGYYVVVEKQAGLQDIKQVYAFRDADEARQKLTGVKGQFEAV